jgi:hypothetical protein
MGMNHGGRIALLTTAVVLLIVGVVCLKQRLGSQELPPAFVPADIPSGPTRDHHLTHEPTILPADPNSNTGNSMHPSWQDHEMAPSGNLAPTAAPTFPVGNDSSGRTGQPFVPWEETNSTQLEPPFGEHSPATQEQIAPKIPETLPTQAEIPTFVITKQDDSLWVISEQAYGEGNFFRALFAVNKERVPRPDRIEAGIEIQTPSIDELRRLYPDLCPAFRDKQGS